MIETDPAHKITDRPGQSSFCAQQSRLGKRACPKIIPDCQLPYPRAAFFHINRRRCRLAFAKNIGSPFKKPIPPSHHDIRLDIEVHCRFGQCLRALLGSRRQNCPKSLGSGSSVVVSSCYLTSTASFGVEAERALTQAEPISRDNSLPFAPVLSLWLPGLW
jgi:hypothetical protein